MNIDEALVIIQRQSPCPHESLDTSLGDGKTWARCEDCGATIEQSRIPSAQKAARQFDDALATIRMALSQSKETTA